LRKAIRVIPVVVALVGAIGCGEDRSSGFSARADGDAISKREYVARSNAHCERTGQKADGAFKRIVGQPQPTPGEEREFMVKTPRFFQQAAIPAIRENVDRRAALPAPDGDEQEIEAIIAAGRKALAGFEEIAADRAKLRALFEGEILDPARRFDALSREYGIDKCGGDQ
jgi:hypothetical protein